MFSHTSLTQGYIPKGTLKRVPYQGKFGKGVKVLSHNPNSTRYCFVSYYIDTPPTNTGAWTREFADDLAGINKTPKIWVVKRTADGHYYVNKKINGKLFYQCFYRTTIGTLKALGICDSKGGFRKCL